MDHHDHNAWSLNQSLTKVMLSFPSKRLDRVINRWSRFYVQTPQADHCPPPGHASGDAHALEELFRYWLRHEAPDRFRRLAFRKYPREFADSAKRDRQRWLKRHAQDVKRGKKNRDLNPLRVSGGRYAL